MEEKRVSIRPAKPNEFESVHALVTANDSWTQFNGPYFPYSHPPLKQFEKSSFQRLLSGSDLQLITVDDNPIGTVSSYWECEETHWLEAGVVITIQTSGVKVSLLWLFLNGYLTCSKITESKGSV